MADELKPCPFCGEQPRTIDDDSYGACMVFCIKCDYTPDQCFKKVGELDQAIAVWNTRAAPPPEPSEAWQPIETVPKNCWVLAWRAHATTPRILKWDAQYDAFENQQGDHVYGLTHWMPLPQPPAIAALRAAKEK